MLAVFCAALAAFGAAAPQGPGQTQTERPSAPAVSPASPSGPQGASGEDVTPGAAPSSLPTGTPAGVPAGAQPGFVAKHVDGDTIWVEVRDPGGPLPLAAVHKIRILEIDTPESTNRKDCLGREASEFAKRELPVGSRVYLLADREDKDRYGRYLRYVWEEDGEFYNEKVVRAGLARAVLYPPNDLYIAHLRAVEAEARRSARGLWTACGNPPGGF